MRLKIIAGNLVAVLLLGLVSYVVVGSDLRQGLATRVQGQVGNNRALLDRSLRLTGFEFVKLAGERAASSDVRGVFSALDEQGRRTRAYEAAERSAAWFGDPARGMRGQPDIVVIADDTGKVIARNADRNRLYGAQLDSALPAVRATLKDGQARHDVWKKDDEGKLLELAVASIRGDSGQIVGVLAVGYDLSNGLARDEGKRLGDWDVAFVVDDKVYSSSLSESVAKQLRSYLFGAGKAVTEAAMGGRASSSWVARLGDDEYVGALGPLPGSPSARVAYAVVANRSEVGAKVADSTKIILALTLVFSLVVIGYGFMLGNSIVRPIEEIEEGVLAAINGNTDLRLDTNNPELGGLAYRINQLLNVFTGVAETSEDDDDGGGVAPVRQADWKDAAFSEAQPATGAASSEALDDPATAQKLEAEPEDAYYARVYQEYVAAKGAAGETVNIPQERFVQRLKGNEQALTKKHGCKAVRFLVQKNGALQPVLIR